MGVLIVLATVLTLIGLVGGHPTLLPLVLIGFALWLGESVQHDRTKTLLDELARASGELADTVRASL